MRNTITTTAPAGASSAARIGGVYQDTDAVFVGEKLWGGLGTELPALASSADVMQACPAVAARVEKEQLFHRDAPVPGQFVTVRQDNGAPLGVVGKRYSILQNEDAFRTVDTITADPNGPKWETAGVLWGGQKAWGLARMPEWVDVAGDQVGQYLLMWNPHDGSGCARFALTNVRVACQNSASMALATAAATFMMRHSGDMLAKAALAGDALGLIVQDCESMATVMNRMAEHRLTREQEDAILAQLIPDTTTNRAELQRDRVRQLAATGVGNERHSGTAWALYNGFTELEDHHNGKGSKREDAADVRLNSILLGTGAARKVDAGSVIADICGLN